MGKTTTEIIKDIAGELDCGLDCYYNPKTQEVISIPSEDALMDFEDADEIFGEALEKVENNDDFVKVEVLKSFESYKIMESFSDEVPDKQLRKQLVEALSRKKPFQNFSYVVDNSHYRQKWFDFKQEALEHYVRQQLGLA